MDSGARRVWVVVAGLVVLAAALFVASPPLLTQTPHTEERSLAASLAPPSAAPSATSASATGKRVASEPALAPSAFSEPRGDTASSTELRGVVERVVDGDTIVVRLVDGKRVRVRAIGIDTPESVDPRKGVECFGKEAAARARELLEGREVVLRLDPTQGTHDWYGRLLAYIFRDDGLFFNLEMIAEGYAHEYTYRIPHQHQQDFQEAERAAREALRGLWNPRTCNGSP